MLSIRNKRILSLSLPIIAAQISQNIVNLIDTAMVGRIGANALAAIGICAFVTFVFQGGLLGISTGVQAQVARRKGEGKSGQLAVPLNSSFILILVLGIPLSCLIYYLSPFLLGFLVEDEGVRAEGIPYLKMRMIGLVFIGMNFSFRSYWNAIDLSKIYLGNLVLVNITNVFLNYCLIFGHFGFPRLGSEGAGLATSLSYILGTVIYLYLGLTRSRKHGFLCKMPKLERIKTLVRLSIPNSIQQILFSAGFTILFWMIGKIGTNELAASNILINLMLVAILPGLGFGMANTTLVGQALGRGDIQDAYKWGWDVTKICLTFVFFITVPFWIIPSQLMGLFTNDQIIIELGRNPLMLTGIIVCIDSAGLTLMNALLGAGATNLSMRISVICMWIIFLPLAYYLGPVLKLDLIHIWLWFAAYRIIQALVFAFYWEKGSWKSIKV